MKNILDKLQKCTPRHDFTFPQHQTAETHLFHGAPLQLPHRRTEGLVLLDAPLQPVLRELVLLLQGPEGVPHHRHLSG